MYLGITWLLFFFKFSFYHTNIQNCNFQSCRKQCILTEQEFYLFEIYLNGFDCINQILDIKTRTFFMTILQQKL